MRKETNFDEKDQLIIDIGFIRSACSVLYYANFDELSLDDLRQFLNGLGWLTDDILKIVENININIKD